MKKKRHVVLLIMHVKNLLSIIKMVHIKKTLILKDGRKSTVACVLSCTA